MFPVKKSRIIVALIILVFTSGAFGFGGAILANHFFSPATTETSDNIDSDSTGFDLQEATGSVLTVQEITKKARDSVVEIKTESVSTDPWMQQYVTEGAGSGVFFKEDGYLLTNEHVIRGANKVTVTTRDEKAYTAKLVGADPDTDVAVLKIDGKDIKTASIGNADKLNVGDLAVAIGNPLGELGGTVTAGIISALDRSLSIEGKTMSLLQTDTSINPGNSGGGLFDQHGQLIGIVVAKSAGSNIEGLGFAIPINRAVSVADQLMKSGYVKGRVTTGMAYTDLSAGQGGNDSFFDQFWNDNGQSGVYIERVDGKNAKKAGFKKGDLVVSVDDVRIDTFETLSSVITSHKVGDKVKYIVLRNEKTITITLELEEKAGS